MRNRKFPKQTCGSFRYHLSLKIVFYAFVCSNLEYCPSIWTNNTSKQIQLTDSVQYNLNIFRPPHGLYELMLKLTNLLSLKNRRTLLLSTFLHNLLIGKIDCQDFFSLNRLKKYFCNTRNRVFYPIPYKIHTSFLCCYLPISFSSFLSVTVRF